MFCQASIPAEWTDALSPSRRPCRSFDTSFARHHESRNNANGVALVGTPYFSISHVARNLQRERYNGLGWDGVVAGEDDCIGYRWSFESANERKRASRIIGGRGIGSNHSLARAYGDTLLTVRSIFCGFGCGCIPPAAQPKLGRNRIICTSDHFVHTLSRHSSTFH